MGSVILQFFQHTELHFCFCFFVFPISKRTQRCGHFPPKNIKIGSRSSENEYKTVQISEHEWIEWLLHFLLLEVTKSAITMHARKSELFCTRSPSSVNRFWWFLVENDRAVVFFQKLEKQNYKNKNTNLFLEKQTKLLIPFRDRGSVICWFFTPRVRNYCVSTFASKYLKNT